MAIGIEHDRKTPVKIAWSETARGFYCPTCITGVQNKTQECPFCGQPLLNMYGDSFEEK